MQPAIPFSYPGTNGDMERLAALLDLALQTIGWMPSPSPSILNLACGRADETGILLERLAPLAHRFFYLGIDLRKPEIQEARQRWIIQKGSGQELEFRTGDASRTDRMNQLPEFDFIFIRHQNFWSDPPLWSRLYRNALARLKPNGRLTITSYFDLEHDLATACLRQLGATQLLHLPHPHSRPLRDAQGKSVDRHLAVFAPDNLY
ncbi:MAG: class I SAM-dependent methyltransferase [Verrucomicrobiales bacterium]